MLLSREVLIDYPVVHVSRFEPAFYLSKRICGMKTVCVSVLCVVFELSAEIGTSSYYGLRDDVVSFLGQGGLGI